MRNLETLSLCVIAFGGASLFAACGSDPSTLPYYEDTGTGSGATGGSTAAAGRGAGGTTSVAGTSQGGTSSATGGSGALGGTGGSLPMSTGGTAGGMSGGSGGAGGSNTSGAGGNAGTGTGAASGAGGTFGQAGASGSGFGFGGRTNGFGGRAGASAGGTSGGSSSGRGGAAGAMTGGAGSSGGQSVTFASVGQFFNDTCGGTMCHGGKEMPSLVNTNPTTLYNTLKSTAVRQCGSDKLVTPNDTANSAVLELVTHKCGTFVMPDHCNTNPCIDQSDVDMLTTWINEGAPGP